MSRCEINETRECTHCGQCDVCDLDPNKICDNCCKCIDSPQQDQEYAVLPVQMRHLADEQGMTDVWEEKDDFDEDMDDVSAWDSFDDEDWQKDEEDDALDPLIIDPGLMRAWEEKLRASFEKTSQEQRPTSLYGRRIRKRGAEE